MALHAGTSSGGGTDATVTFTDITTNNSSTAKHGFLRKLDNNAAHYMDGTGAWSTPGGLSAAALELVSSQTLLADATDVTFSSLNGNNDIKYLLNIDMLKGAAGFFAYELQPNGLTTNQTSKYFSDVTSVSSPATLQWAKSGSGIGATIMAEIILVAKTGFIRQMYAYNVEYGGGASFYSPCGGTWNEDATNITSLVLHAAATDGFKAGSIFSLYKMTSG